MASVSSVTPCVEYEGNRNAKGYGRYGQQLVHRLVWQALYGPVPEGMVVMHKCDNPACYRLDHLMLGTKTDNARDMLVKGRHWSGPNAPHYEYDPTRCRNGHEYTPDNTYRDPSRGTRSCRACGRERNRRWRARQH